MVFLNSKSTERMITTQNLSAPNIHCPVCSPMYAKLKLPSGTSHPLSELVDELKSRFDYEDFSITTSAGLIYDPDLEDNLPKKLSAFVLKNESWITAVDEEDEQPRVNLELVVIVPDG